MRTLRKSPAEAPAGAPSTKVTPSTSGASWRGGAFQSPAASTLPVRGNGGVLIYSGSNLTIGNPAAGDTTRARMACGMFVARHNVLINADIPPYSGGNRFNHEPRRHRKLLLHRKQIGKLIEELELAPAVGAR